MVALPRNSSNARVMMIKLVLEKKIMCMFTESISMESNCSSKNIFFLLNERNDVLVRKLTVGDISQINQ